MMKLALSIRGDSRRLVKVTSYEEASAVWLKFLVEANYGASFGGSDMTRDCGQLYDPAGNKIAYVSYNGRVWAGTPQDWRPGNTPILEPAEEEKAS